MILAPLRGVTIRTFRRVFAAPMAEARLTESVQPFVPAMRGLDPFKDRELSGGPGNECATPQFIGKDPAALRECLKRIKDAGWEFADLNCGCPFPMIRKKGRGSGILKTPGVLAAPDDGWAVMNVRKLARDLRTDAAKERFLAPYLPYDYIIK